MHSSVTCSRLQTGPTCAALPLHVQEELAQRAQRFGSNSVRRPRETTFWQLVQEALQASTGGSAWPARQRSYD